MIFLKPEKHFTHRWKDSLHICNHVNKRSWIWAEEQSATSFEWQRHTWKVNI